MVPLLHCSQRTGAHHLIPVDIFCVTLQMVSSRKAFATKLTLVRFFPCVYPRVLRMIFFGEEQLAAKFARMMLDLKVCPFTMVYQCGAAFEGSTTICAEEGLDVIVHAPLVVL